MARKPAKANARRQPAVQRAADAPPLRYPVTLRTHGKAITTHLEDAAFYPRATAWNRLLSADRGRQKDPVEEKQSWRSSSQAALLELAGTGGVSSGAAKAFLDAAAVAGVVQVEMEWQREDRGWAARVFPWETLLALATKRHRESQGQRFMAVRYLKVKAQQRRAEAARGAAVFAVMTDALAQGFDVATEEAAIRASLSGELTTVQAKSLDQLRQIMREKQPAIVHLVLASAEAEGEAGEGSGAETAGRRNYLQQLAGCVASHGPTLVVFSTCHSGRRLAPLAVAAGARAALGFHGEVMDSSIPVFFGAFYRAWSQGVGPLESLRAGLLANKSQLRPDDLGAVTLWSSEDLLGAAATAGAGVTVGAKGEMGEIPPEQAAQALQVRCKLEKALNYSMLHNRRGGVFAAFDVTKIKEGPLDKLEVRVWVNTGLDKPAECHFYCPLPPEADRRCDLADRVSLPLGSELLRRRGEMLRGTVEVSIQCAGQLVFHHFDSIELPPCDEWLDNQEGRRFLPSFVFPRDPAVREVLQAAQPFLRALCDEPHAGFDGYQSGFSRDPREAVELQVRAVWAALHSLRLDYTNPPPAYTLACQRLRTPEEILRARRATCIELALLLASCWEHVGIFPAIFLTSGHAFVGYWTSESARSAFMAVDNLKKHAAECKETDSVRKPGAGSVRSEEAWMLTAPHHLAAIRGVLADGKLVPVEATYVPLQRSLREAVEEATALLRRISMEEFDGMIDVQTARDKGVTPLAIVTRDPVA